jgi:tRNA threonylcarbamoyladenosine biosynthesis protein TsaB
LIGEDNWFQTTYFCKTELSFMTPSGNTCILQINTALSEASVGLGVDGQLQQVLKNSIQQQHAAFLQPAIQTLCSQLDIPLKALDAVAVMNGPGSYTGLRVGLSAAKGICYALGIPLICINTLQWISAGNGDTDADLICPMIDARRMEVFTAVFNKKQETVLAPAPMILEAQSFLSVLENNRMAFIGDGASKWQTICNHPNAIFPEPEHGPEAFHALACKAFEQKDFADLAYAEPFYLKGFFSAQPSSKPA